MKECFIGHIGVFNQLQIEVGEYRYTKENICKSCFYIWSHFRIVNYDEMLSNFLMTSKDWQECKPNNSSLLTSSSKFNFFRDGRLRFKLRNGEGEVLESKMFVREDSIRRPVTG